MKTGVQQSFLELVSVNRSAIMGLSMVFIMLFHQYFTSVFPFNLFHNYGHWGVDVFLFLSGMGLVNSLEKNSIKDYYKRRFMRLVPSCIFCGSLKYLVSILLGVIVVNYSKDITLSIWALASLDLWFIPTIIIFYLIFPILYYLLREWRLFSFLCLVVLFFLNELTLRPLVGLNWESPVGVVSWTLERLPVFAYGIFVSINRNIIGKRICFSFLFLLTAVFLKLIEKKGMTASFMEVEQACLFLSLTMGVPALIMVFVRFLEKIPKGIYNSISFLGVYSLEIYLVHEFILWSLIALWRNGNPWILLPFGLLLSTILAYLCKLCTRIILQNLSNNK